MKVQINNLEALERLLGGDTEFEFELRQNVADTFAKKYLKGLVTTQLESGIKQQIPKILKEEGILVDSNLWSIKLTPSIVGLIRNSVDNEIKSRISSESAQKVLAPILEAFAKELQEQIRKAAERIATELHDQVLTNKIDLLVNAKIKERLGLK